MLEGNGDQNVPQVKLYTRVDALGDTVFLPTSSVRYAEPRFLRGLTDNFSVIGRIPDA